MIRYILVLGGLAVLGLVAWGGWLRFNDGAAGVPLPDRASWQDRSGPVVVLGTSLSARAAWPEQLGRALSDCAVRPVDVQVVARPGANAAWGAEQAAYVAGMGPALVLVEFEANDADILDGLWPWESRRMHARILSEILHKSPQTETILMIMNPAYGARGLARIARPFYRQSYYRLAHAHGIGLVDMTGNWRKRVAALGRDRVIPDGLHPTDDAAGDIVVPALVAALCEHG
jgi:hypothetical protein